MYEVIAIRGVAGGVDPTLIIDLEARVRCLLHRKRGEKWDERESKIILHYIVQLAKRRMSLNTAIDKTLSDINGRKQYGVA